MDNDYLKCIYVNKATLGGWAILGLSGVSMGLGVEFSDTPYTNPLAFVSYVSFISGFLITGMTACSIQTYNSYKSLKAKINRGDEFTTEGFSDVYCSYKGQELAAKEAGLEHLLPKKFWYKI